MNPHIPPGLYRHYKGNLYEVIDTATHSESREALVVYRALYGDFGTWVRPATMFAETVVQDGAEVPRFAWQGPSDIVRLGPTEWLAARRFLHSQARPLESALFDWQFEGGSDRSVLDALATFQNTDGGFGHGLEPDLRTPHSSALATSHALQVLRLLGAPADEPLVEGVLAWLSANLDPTTLVWDLIPADANDAPHAPWWTLSPEHAAAFGYYRINPRAELLGYLYDYPQLAKQEVREAVTADVMSELKSRVEPLNMMELLAVQRLAQTRSLPETHRAALQSVILHSLPATVAYSPEEWLNYSLQPLQVAAAPSSPYAVELALALQDNLDYVVETQESDGSWQPTWSWGPLFPDSWPVAAIEWRGILTLEALRNLTHWARVAR